MTPPAASPPETIPRRGAGIDGAPHGGPGIGDAPHRGAGNSDAPHRGAGNSDAPRRGAGTGVSPRRAAQAAARRHSRLVRSLKLVLPLAALAGAGLLAAQALLFNYAPDLKLPTVLFSKDGLTMVEPRLSGRSKDRAYEVNAVRAVQALDDPKRVRLERIDARIELADRQWAKVEAKSGLYDGTRERLGLDEGLTVVTSNGYRAATEGADFDLTTGRMVSRAPIRIDGPAATITGDRLEITDNGRTFVFTGNVRMELRPGAAPATTAPATAAPVAPAPISADTPPPAPAAERLAGSGGQPGPVPQ